MGSTVRKRLIFHGAIVVLLGLIAGIPYAYVETGAIAGSARAWGSAHLQGLLNGMLVWAVAAVLRRLSLSDRQISMLEWSLLAMAYGNTVASTAAAAFGVRGLEFKGPAANVAVHLLFLVALVGAFAAVGLVAYGARGGREEPATRVTVEVTDSAAPKESGEEGAASRRRRRKRRG